ncbi:hypothetical protein VPH35_091811 [Triticum aestivum]|uniref:uncharacterized protein n=1 Tax=Triticum aestivum TaxID=4565 RepID=UPI0008425371|nr:uncharacterized protein LOC123116760 [Triticum aestivum]
MASQLGPPSPSLEPAATTADITAIGEDLLREVFLRLPSPPSLVRATLACRTFLCTVRSCPIFLHRFLALHPPQILGFFEGWKTGIPLFIPFRDPSDPDLAAAVCGADFLLTRLLEDSGDPGWDIKDCRCGHLLLHNRRTKQIAAYNPLTQALDIFPHPPRETCGPRYLLYRIIFPKEDQRAFHVVCFRRRKSCRGSRLRISVFSSVSREWQCFSWVCVQNLTPQPRKDGGDVWSYIATLVSGSDRLAYWKDKDQAYMVVLNTPTPHLSPMGLPPPSEDYELGRTKDGKLCLVCIDDVYANKGTLAVWFCRVDSDGSDEWMPHKVFPLSAFIDVTMCSEEYDVMVQVVMVLDGFVFLSVSYARYTECLISFCLETENVNKLFTHTLDCNIHPYFMVWPPSLVRNEEDSDTKLTSDNVTDDGPVGIEATPSVFGLCEEKTPSTSFIHL